MLHSLNIFLVAALLKACLVFCDSPFDEREVGLCSGELQVESIHFVSGDEQFLRIHKKQLPFSLNLDSASNLVDSSLIAAKLKVDATELEQGVLVL
jgi:hypothetical protein